MLRKVLGLCDMANVFTICFIFCLTETWFLHSQFFTFILILSFVSCLDFPTPWLLNSPIFPYRTFNKCYFMFKSLSNVFGCSLWPWVLNLTEGPWLKCAQWYLRRQFYEKCQWLYLTSAKISDKFNRGQLVKHSSIMLIHFFHESWGFLIIFNKYFFFMVKMVRLENNG